MPLLAVLLLYGCAGGPDRAEPGGGGSAYLDLGVAYLGQDEPRAALQALRKARERDPDDARVHNALGLVYQQLSFEERARSAFEKAVALDPEDPQVRNNYGVFLANHGEYDQAGEQFRKALSNPMYSTPETAYYNLGWIARRQGKPQTAEEHLRTAVELRPGYARAHLTLIRLLADRDGLEAARAEARQLVERRPDLARAHLLAGELALEASDNAAARRHFQAAAERDKEGPAGRRARKLLRQLEGPEAALQGRKG